AVTGANSDGIYANNSATGTSLTIDAQGTVSGGGDGIRAINNGSGTTTITTGSAVTGGTGFGINTSAGAGGNTVITLNAGAAVSSAAGLGIFNDAGNSATTVNAGASVAGVIRLNDGSDDLIFAGGDFSAVTLFDGGDDISAADTFIDTLTFAGAGGALTGATVINWENVVIGTGATVSFTDNALTAGTLAVNGGGTLDATGGALAIIGNLANSGTVNAQDGAANDTVTVSGGFTGGGAFLVDVDFAADTADTLVVAGNVTGAPTAIAVADITAGVATGNDVLVVDVTGTTAAGDFTLAGGPVTSGAFDYILELQGTQFFLAAGMNATGAMYEAVPAVLSAFNRLPTLEQRIGGRDKRAGQAAWIRVRGDDAEASLSNRNNTDSTIWGIQAGADLDFEAGQNGRWVLGITGQYGSLDASVSTPTGSGSIDTTGYGLGATATWYGNQGAYVDVQGQINWLDSDFSSSTAGALRSGKSSTAYALSVEGGRRFAFGPNAAIIPQAQLTWGSIDGGSFTDTTGSAVDLESNDSLIGRVGVAYEYSKDANQKVYVIGNLLHDFSSDTNVNVAGANLRSDASSSDWGEIGLGGSVAFGNMQVYGETSYRTALGGRSAGSDNGLSGTIGLRIKW
ncbi:hypothetical protein MNBD_ALPHA07-2160, partial [hydrothermal vent metagenome]